jgi:hypothetical protein
VTIDASAVSALAEGDHRVRAHLEMFRRHDVEVVVPAAAIVQALVGKRLHDARVNVVIGGCRVADMTDPIARRAAVLRQKAGQSDATVDAMVVATSELVGGGALLTCRAEAYGKLAALASVQVERA